MTKRGRPTTLVGPLADLAALYGGVDGLATTIGVSRRTLTRWGSGDGVPPRPARLMLALLAREHKLKPPFGTEEVCPRPAWLDEVHEDREASPQPEVNRRPKK